jgi:hypothetical protein
MGAMVHLGEWLGNACDSSPDIQFVAHNAQLVVFYEGESSDET